MSIWQMSFYGAVLILVITVVRGVAINKLSKKTFLILWGIALVRLLIPFSIPSTLSVYSFFNQNDTFEGSPIGNMISIMPETQMEPIGEMQQAHLQQQLVERVPSVSVWSVIWCIGAVFSIVLFAIIYLSWLRRFQTSMPVCNSFVNQWLEAHRLRRPISIRQSDRIEAPLTYGIIHPVILMPKGTDWEDTKKLQYILLHEYVHICRYDTVIKMIAALALCIHWFNPLVYVMYILLNRDLELSCDESVVRRFGVASRSTYAHILISMEAKKSGLMPFYNSFSKNAIEERITSIMKIKKASIFAILTAVVLIIGISSVFVTSAAMQSETQPEPQSELQQDPTLPYDPSLEPGGVAQLSPQDLEQTNGGTLDNQQNTDTGINVTPSTESEDYIDQELENMITLFYTAYFNKDIDTIEQYLAESYHGDLSVVGNEINSLEDVEIFQIKGWKNTVNKDNIGDECEIYLEFKFPNEDSYTYLTIGLIKEDSGWKINGYGLEK